jgi:polyisoprenoid-binding protein YceI
MGKFVLDPDHTSADFTVRHMMVTWVNGHFRKVSGTLYFDPLKIAESSVEVEIDVASICTGAEKRDNDLRSPNYFDVDKYPKITFKSTRVESVGLDYCLVHGDLTIHGVTRPATLDVHYAGPSHFQDEDQLYTTFGFQATTTVNREEFGMLANLELEHGGFMVGKHAYLTLNAEADLVEE